MNDLITKIPVGPTLNEKRKVRKERQKYGQHFSGNIPENVNGLLHISKALATLVNETMAMSILV